MKFRRWVVFTLAIHALVLLLDKGAGLVLYILLRDQPAAHGAASLVASLPYILMAVANLGLATSLVFHVRKGLYGAQAAFENTMLVALMWGGVVGLGGFVVTEYLLPLLGPEWQVNPMLLVPMCAAVPLLLITSYGNSLQLAMDRIKAYNGVHLLSSLLFLPLFLAFYFGPGFSAEDAARSVAWGRLVSAGIVTLTVLWMLRKVIRYRLRWDRGFLRDNVGFGWKANITSVLTYLNHRVDLYILGLLFVPVLAAGLTEVEATETRKQLILQQVAFYSLAVTFAELVWHFPEAMRDLFFSKVSGSTDAHARTLTPVLSRMGLAVSALAGVGVWLAVDPVMGGVTWLIESMSAEGAGKFDAWNELWREPVLESVMWLLPGTVAFTVGKVLQADLQARKLQDECVVACMIVLVVMLAMDFWLVPEQGAKGAAIASSVAYIASAIYSLWAYRKSTGVPVLQCIVPRWRDREPLVDIVSAVWAKIRRKQA